MSVVRGHGRISKTHHIACIWSFKSLAFAIIAACRRVAENELWVALESYTLQISHYGTRINDLIREMGKDDNLEFG